MAIYSIFNNSGSTASFEGVSIGASANLNFYDDSNDSISSVEEIKTSLSDPTTTPSLGQLLGDGTFSYRIDNVNQTTNDFFDFFQSFKEDTYVSILEARDSGRKAITSTSEGIEYTASTGEIGVEDGRLVPTIGTLDSKANLSGATFTGAINAPTVSGSAIYSGDTLLENVFVAPVNLDGDKGDIVVSNSGGTYTIDTSAVNGSKIQNNAVLNTKLADMTTQTLKGRVTASTGDPEDLTPEQARSVLGVDIANPSYTSVTTSSISATSASATTLYSGSTDISSLFAPSGIQDGLSPFTDGGGLNSITTVSGSNSAIGARAVVLGGEGNTSSGGYAVTMGSSNTASGGFTHAGGYGNNAVGNYAFVHSRQSDINTGANSSAILGGFNNTLNSSASRSIILGGQNIIGNEADTIYGINLNASGAISAATIYSGSTDLSSLIGGTSLTGLTTINVPQASFVITSQTSVDSASYTTLPFEVQDYGDDSFVQYSAGSSSQFVIQKDASYDFDGHISVSSTTTTYRLTFQIGIFVNGLVQKELVGGYVRGTSGSDEGGIDIPPVTLDLNTNDYVEIRIKRISNTSGNGVTVPNMCYLRLTQTTNVASGSLFSGFGTTNVQPGTNITTGGTAGTPVINLADSISLSSVDATSILSGGTNIDQIFGVKSPFIGNPIDGSITTLSGSNTASGNYASVAGGQGNDASGDYSFVAGGLNNTASGLHSHAEGYNTTASGNRSHTEGYNTIASSNNSHAEGAVTQATANRAHAEGLNTLASGEQSHAEGYDTVASGTNAHAEGRQTTAGGTSSHAGGFNTLANADMSFATGRDNTVTGVQGFIGGRDNTASGEESFTFSSGSTNNANQSAILGGLSNELTSNAVGSVILGGQGITGNQPDTIYGVNIDVTGSISATTIYSGSTDLSDLLGSGGGGEPSDGDKGDITVSSGGATWTIDNNVVSDAKLRDSSALSVIGRSVNSTGDPADIAAASDGQVLRRIGTSLGFGTVASAGISSGAITNVKLDNMAEGTLKGRPTGSGLGPPTDLVDSQIRTLINVEDGATADQTDGEIETAYNNQVDVVSQAEAEAGTATTVRRWTAERVGQAISALGGGGGGATGDTITFTFAEGGTIGAGDVFDVDGVADMAITIPFDCTVSQITVFYNLLTVSNASNSFAISIRNLGTNSQITSGGGTEKYSAALTNEPSTVYSRRVVHTPSSVTFSEGDAMFVSVPVALSFISCDKAVVQVTCVKD